jgi:hypothetical protein
MGLCGVLGQPTRDGGLYQLIREKQLSGTEEAMEVLRGTAGHI